MDFFRVGQHALLGFEALVFSRLQLGVFNFARLECPQIEQTQAVLLVALEFLDAILDALPFGECFCRRFGLMLAKLSSRRSRVEASKESSDSFWAWMVAR